MELTKEEFRQRYLARLKRDEKLHLEASGLVVKNLSQLLANAKGPVAAFRAMSTEPILQGLVESLNLDWVFPRVEGETLTFYRSTWSELSPGAYNVFEPKAEPSSRVQLNEISWALVPGVSFDRHGTRLGRGKAFYDKTFKNYSGVRVGVCFAEGLSNVDLPKEEHDLDMDWLVSDRFIMRSLAA